MSGGALVPVTLSLVKALTYIYEIITWPLYYFLKSPNDLAAITGDHYGEGRHLAQSIRSDDPSTPWRCLEAMDQLTQSMVPGCETLDDLWKRAVSLWADKPALGTRKVLKSEMEVQKSGRQFKKLTLGPYYWETYGTVDKRIETFGSGLLALGMRPRVDRVLIFAETRSEWMLSAQACFRYNIPLVTLYSTLGDDAVVHGITEAEVSVVITSDELLPKLVRLLRRTPNVRHVIFMANGIFQHEQAGEGEADSNGQSLISQLSKDLPSGVQLHVMTGIEELGAAVTPVTPDVKPKRADLAVIMYTSGSTGQPKGVEISHGNLMTGMSGQGRRLPGVSPESDIYIGYLPLAHVLELCCEMVVLSVGIRVGYSNPQTLTDTSSKIKARCCRGDVVALRPTLMAGVPTILDRISKAVWEKVNEGGELSREMFKFAYNYKQRRLAKGYPSIILDRLVFKKIRNLLGGRIRFMLSGGAPLSEESQVFMNVCFCPIIQGYGLTETCGAGTLMIYGDLRGNQVGAPLTCLQIQLRDWPEGRYSPEDKPRPRGEILIGGGCVTQGYFKQPEKTKEDFFVDSKGMRWFCTGDIGLFHSDGSLSIIDRKKDLVKLQGGEYVSLGKVELVLTQCPVVETVCIFADPMQDYTVCFVSPKKKQLSQMGEKLGLDPALLDDHEALCKHPQVKAALLKELQGIAVEKRLERFEIPSHVHLDPDPWTADSGLVTDALKLKRRNIQEKFQAVINQMYAKPNGDAKL